MKNFALIFTVCVLFSGCAGTGRSSSEKQSDGYAGALSGDPAKLEMRVEGEDGQLQAEGRAAGGEEGIGEGEVKGEAGLGVLFYIYLAVGVILLFYLLWLITRKVREHRYDHDEGYRPVSASWRWR